MSAWIRGGAAAVLMMALGGAAGAQTDVKAEAAGPVAPEAVIGPAGPVEFNQHEIEAVWREYGVMNEEDERLAARSAASAATTDAGASEVNFDDPSSVLRLVLSRCPGVAVVYPTETYYYYRFELAGRRIAGNVRLLDAAEGKLHIGYFDRDDRTRVRSATFTSAEGVAINTRAENEFDVAVGGRTVTFVLPRRALVRPAGLELLESEEFVSGILDESAVALCLLFNNTTKCFYYVLNPEIPTADELGPVEGAGERWSIGARSKFVFYRDQRYDRRLLVGVSSENVALNSPFDGPFDQVPPRLPLREKLEAAYPYVKYRGGIDEHGNFIELKDQRVAISPYQTYDDLGLMMQALDNVDRDALVASERWSRMTMEPKQGYDPAVSSSAPSGWTPQHVAQGWPANHWGDNSRAWPEDHFTPGSAGWQPNHVGMVSRMEKKEGAAEEK